MSEPVPQDVPPPGTPIRDLTPEPLLQDQDPQQQQHEEQESQELLQSEDADGGLSTTDDDDNRKMSQDSLISASPRGSPLPHPTARRCYQDSDSCPSVSPSPDPESRLQTFEFSMAEVPVEGEAISAALQTEREFLDFMLSLPQVQKEGPGRPLQTQKEGPGRLPQVQKEGIDHKEGPGQPSQEAPLPLQSEQRSPTRAPATVGGLVGTKVGLDHLDNLCRMMEQLGELREQNTRLQRRVHYLEELQTLQEMHRHLQETLEARRSGLGLGPVHLSDSDLHIDDDGDGGGGELSRHGSEESLLLLTHRPPHKDQFLEPPESPGRRHSSSEEDRRPPALDSDVRARPHDKEKKGRRSAWGKVKNMISTRRDSVRKKSSSAQHRKSTVERPSHDLHAGVAVEVSAASDPEDYEVDDEGLVGEAVDPGGSAGLCLEVSEGEWETGGVWTGPREDDPPVPATSLGVRRAKPQLTITVPSSENLSHMQGGGDRPRQPHRSPEANHRKISPAQLDPRVPPSLPMTPPSPRRASNWTKVKKAFLTGQQHQPIKAEVQAVGSGDSASLPPSPNKKTAFHFDAPPHLAVESSALYEFDSPMATLEVSSDDLVSQAHSTPTPSPQPHSTPSPQPHTTHQQHSGVQRNLADLQKSLSGEFSRRLQEWEKLRGGVSQGLHPPLTASGSAAAPTAGVLTSHPEDNLPYEFRKKLHEWEKMKEREKEKGKPEVPRGQEDVKTKKHGEDDLPADFRKKLTEWEIRKALAGKSQQNVEELQKNLGEEFNRKMAEWERIKASANQGHIKPTPGHPQVKSSASAGNIQIKSLASAGQMHLKASCLSSQSQVKTSASASQVLVKPFTVGPGSSPRLDRKGSAHKIKKIKSSKTDKAPMGKAEGGHKGRDKSDKELQWLEKELHKVERETQRLEREKEKFLERQARLEKMRQAMGQGGPAKKKEIYIKTSTGEFRFEGISQTFTKKLYEWEERRGIRPESSTIALLDPNYKAPEKEVQEKPKSPELVRLVRSKSESSMVADLVPTSVHSHASSHSLNEIDTDDPVLQAENKAASEPTLAADDPTTPKVAVLVQLEEVVDDSPSLHDPATPYAPAEITRNIDSSGSEEDVTRRRRADDDEDVVTNLRRSDSSRTQGSYRSLLHENMSLLDKLRQQEDLCRALETQMGDIDSKMDNVADQHLRTLEKLHRQVTIMKDSSSTPLEGGDPSTAADDAEANQRLINQLRARIVELEMRGDHLMEEKEQLERAFKLHKEHETEIAESLVQRIRELQDAGAEVNIQTVQCQSHDLSVPPEDSVVGEDHLPEDIHEEQEAKEEAGKATPEDLEQEEPKKEALEIVEKEEVKVERREGRTREHRKVKKAPPKKVQKLHNLTADLLLQAKRLEQALVAKHGLNRRADLRGGAATHAASYRQRSLRGRSSLRLVGDAPSPQRRSRATPARTWSSIEAITVPGDSPHESGNLEGGVSLDHGAASSATAEAGTLVLSRSFRGPSSYSSYTCDPQDLLAMNAELSRMAKELRTEMMKMWSFRDSTSPESETSEPRSVRDLEETEGGTDQLVAEANEVFQSIALLQKDSSPPSPHAGRSPSTRSQRSPSTTSLSKRRESAGLEEKRPRREDRDRRSANSTPSRRDSYRQQQQQQLEEEEEQHQKETDISVFLPGGATLGELLMRTQQHYEEEDEEERTWEGPRRRSSDGLSTVTSGPSRSHSPSPSIASSAPEAESSPRLDEDEDSISLAGTWKTTTTSTTRSGEHMLSSSFEWESEDTEERKKPRGRWRAVVEEEDEETEDLKKPKGRWQAVAEEDEDETEKQKKAKGRWQAVVEDEEDKTEQKKKQGRWQIVVKEKEEETEERKKPKGRWQAVVEEEQEETGEPMKIKGKWQAVVKEEEEEEEEEEETEEQKKPKGRWQAIVEEEKEETKEPKKAKGRWQAVVEEETEEIDEPKRPKRRWQAVVEEEKEEDRETPKPQMSSREVKDASRSFETEVTVSLSAARQAGRDLRTRRISDTQVEYESFGQNNRDECFANTFSRTVYDDEALTAGRLSRNPSIRTASSRDADDSSWRRLRALPSMMPDDPSHPDRSPDVFVPTKRTIFTVQGGMSNPEHARATPTFVDSQDDQKVGVAPWRRSHSRPTTPAENYSTPTTPLQERKNCNKDNSGLLPEDNVQEAVKKDKNEIKSENRVRPRVLSKCPQSLNIDLPESVAEINQNDSLTKQTQLEVTGIDLKSDKVVLLHNENENGEPSNTTAKKQTSTQEDILEVLTPTSEALDAVISLSGGQTHCSSRQRTPTQFAASLTIPSSVLQRPPCTTPPIESKKKVLEAANEGVPTVRNIIQKFNQRITENQELLGSPFRSPPNSPPWQSPRTQRKILAGLMAGHDKENTDVSQSDMPSLSQLPHSLNLNSSDGVLKSLSASVIVSNSEVPQQVQRSASGPVVQGSKSSTNDVHTTTSTGLIPSSQLSIFKGPSSRDVWSVSPPASPAISPEPTDPDTSCDMDISADDTGQLFHDHTTASKPENRSPASHLRALRIKRAKEEFLARGAAPLTTEQRLSGCHDSVKLRHRSGTTSTEDSWRESEEICAGGSSHLPSPTPTEESGQDKEEIQYKPPRITSRRRNIPKKESFRRQSAGCLLEESTSQLLSSQVMKSASSGVLGSEKRHSRYSVESDSPDRRKASVDPSVDSNKSSLGIFKLFRRSKNKDKKDMPSVQRLCRQSLLVDFANGKGRTKSASPQPYPDSQLHALPEVDGEDAPETARSSRTLPRGSSGEAAPPAPSRSCPSSPVARHRSRTANWLARGRQIFKSRSPSPGKKPR